MPREVTQTPTVLVCFMKLINVYFARFFKSLIVNETCMFEIFSCILLRTLWMITKLQGFLRTFDKLLFELASIVTVAIVVSVASVWLKV